MLLEYNLLQKKRVKKIKNYKIQDRKSGNVIETGLTLDEAVRMLAQFEEEDKQDGTYMPNFYEVVEE